MINKRETIASLIMSVLGLYPIVIILIYFISKDSMWSHAQFPMNSAGTVVTLEWIIHIVVISIISILGCFLAIHFYKKTGQKKFLTLMFFGGAIIFPLTLINLKIFFGYKSSIILSIAFLLIPIPIISVGYAKRYDVPFDSRYKEVAQVSIDPNEPNIIEIFADGLDWEYVKNDALNDPQEWSDFEYYPKYVTRGFYTGTSLDWIIRGDEDTLKMPKWTQHGEEWYKFARQFGNRFADHKSNKRPADKKIGENVTNKMPANGRSNDKKLYGKYPTNKEIPGDYSTKDKQQNFYSTMGAHDYKPYWKTWTSSERVVDKYIPKNVNYVNYVTANKIIGNKINAFAPAYAPYEAFRKSVTIGKPSYTHMEDHIAHIPSTTAANGHFDMFATTQDTYSALNNFLRGLKTKMLALNDGNKEHNAWDNTSIIIYGDHASHSRKYITFGSGTVDQDRQKNESLLMVKPLKKYWPKDHFIQNSKALNISTRAIYAPFTQRILNKIRDGFNPLEFVENNKNFNPDRIFSSDFGGGQGYFISRYENNGPDAKLECYPSVDFVNDIIDAPQLIGSQSGSKIINGSINVESQDLERKLWWKN